MLVISLLLIVLGFISYSYLRTYKYWQRKGVTQNRYPIPPLGDHFDQLVKGYSLIDLISNIYNRFPSERFTGIYQLQKPVLVVRDPQLIKQICVKNFDHFVDHRTLFPEGSDKFWDENLFALKGQKWKEMRAILNPCFTGSKIKRMFPLMQECADNLIKHFADDSRDVIEVEMKDLFTRYTNDLIATTAFGVQCDSLKVKDNEFYIRGRQTTDLTGFWRNFKLILVIMIPWTGRFLRGIIFDSKVSNFFREIIRESLEFREKNLTNRPDMLNSLMQARTKDIPTDIKAEHTRNLSLDDITSQSLVFFFAAFESVSSAICFMAYELAVNPDIQKVLTRELDDFRSTEEKLTCENLEKLPYLDMVFCETMRKWPPTPATDRVCVDPFTIQPEKPAENPVQLSVGDAIWIPIYAIHRDSKYWENPEEFNPERFSQEKRSKIVPYTYLPFGVGPRNCIGYRFSTVEVKLAIYSLLERFEIVPIEKSDIPFIPKKRCITLTSENGFWFGLKKRNLNLS